MPVCTIIVTPGLFLLSSVAHAQPAGRYARLQPWLMIDADVAFSIARFSDDQRVGNYIPGTCRRHAADLNHRLPLRFAAGQDKTTIVSAAS